jgi:predicted transcriptional regulator
VGRLTKLEMAIMEVLWAHGPASVREIQERFPRKGRPSTNSISTVAARMKGKGLAAVAGKTGTANIYQAAISREAVQRRVMDEMLGLFAGQAFPLMSHLIATGKLSLPEVEAAEKRLRAGWRKRGKP